jgi:hypothetical protein
VAAVSVGHQTRKREAETKCVARSRGDAPQPLGTSSKPTFTLKTAIRTIDDQCKNNTEGKLRLWIEFFDDF